MRLLLIIPCAVLCVVGCGDQGRQALDLGTDAEFKDIFFLDEQNGWIVGGANQIEGGILGRTRDGGATWDFRSGLVAKRSGVFLFHLNAIQFRDENLGYVVADGGVILHTEDGGENWQIVRRGSRVSDHLFDLDFVDDLHAWAVGLGGVVHSENGGRAWKRDDNNRDLSGRAIQFLDLQCGWLVGQFAKVLHTTDGGATWERVGVLGPDKKPNLTSVHFIDDWHGWIVGEGSLILHTEDGGESWMQQHCGVDAYLTSVRFLDVWRGWTVGYNRAQGKSFILRTVDGGTTWTLQTTVAAEELQALYVLGASGWAVGDRVRKGPQKLIRFDTSP